MLRDSPNIEIRPQMKIEQWDSDLADSELLGSLDRGETLKWSADTPTAMAT